MKKIKELLLYANWKNIFFSLLGSAIIAFGTHYFYVQSNIPETGLMGVSIIIQSLTGISPAISFVVLTALCYLLAWRLMGTHYILNTAVSTIGFAVFYLIFSSDPLKDLIPPLTEYTLLATLLGAIMIEFGSALIHRYGSASSGDQALAIAISKRGGFDIGWIQFLRDFIILAFSIVIYPDPADGIYPVIYAIIIMTLLTPITDYIVNAPKKAKFAKRVQRTQKSWVPIIIFGLVLVIIMSTIAMYLIEVLPADSNRAKDYIKEYNLGGFTITEEDNVENDKDMLIYRPTGEIKAGFIFYPGGKIEYSAYEALMAECASNGILCVVVEMPFNLAVLNINKAMDVVEEFPYVDNWYIGGHSLGGSMSASCAATYPEKFKGIVFLAAYSTVDLSDFRVLSIYGTNDEVMERENYEKYRKNLPNDFSGKLTEVKINGGNHAYFGMYNNGIQKGDGVATITNSEQIHITALEIIDFILTE